MTRIIIAILISCLAFNHCQGEERIFRDSENEFVEFTSEIPFESSKSNTEKIFSIDETTLIPEEILKMDDTTFNTERTFDTSDKIATIRTTTFVTETHPKTSELPFEKSTIMQDDPIPTTISLETSELPFEKLTKTAEVLFEKMNSVESTTKENSEAQETTSITETSFKTPSTVRDTSLSAQDETQSTTSLPTTLIPSSTVAMPRATNMLPSEEITTDLPHETPTPTTNFTIEESPEEKIIATVKTTLAPPREASSTLLPMILTTDISTKSSTDLLKTTTAKPKPETKFTKKRKSRKTKKNNKRNNILRKSIKSKSTAPTTGPVIVATTPCRQSFDSELFNEIPETACDRKSLI